METTVHTCWSYFALNLELKQAKMAPIWPQRLPQVPQEAKCSWQTSFAAPTHALCRPNAPGKRRLQRPCTPFAAQMLLANVLWHANARRLPLKCCWQASFATPMQAVCRKTFQRCLRKRKLSTSERIPEIIQQTLIDFRDK